MSHTPQEKQQLEGLDPRLQMAGGIGFTFLIALLGLGLSKINGFNLMGPLACSIIICLLYTSPSPRD